MKRTLLLLCFVLAKFGLQFGLTDPAYGLHRDEFLHLDQGKHLAWGYLSVPPFTSWMAFLIDAFGGDVFWVRFFPAAFGALTLLVVWKTVESLGGTTWALVIAASGVTFSALLRLNMLFQPNSADIFFWTLLFYLMLRYLMDGKVKWLYFSSLAFALAFYNKYTVLFLAAGLFAGLLLSGRKALFSRHVLLAGGLALLLISPNLYWQVGHDFPVVWHMRKLAKTQLQHVDMANFTTEQFLFFAASVPVWITGLYALAAHTAFRPLRPLFWAVLVAMGLFVACSAKSYYTIGLYPFLIAAGAAFLGRKDLSWLRYARPILAAAPVLFVIGMAKYLFPVLSPPEIRSDKESFAHLGLLRWEDGQEHLIPQDFADMLSWPDMARLVDRALAGVPKTEVLVFCDNYGQAGAVNFYSESGVSAVSFNADYAGWFDLSRPIGYVVLVRNAWEEDARITEAALFGRIDYIGEVTDPFARENGTKVYLLSEPKTDLVRYFRKELAAESDWAMP